MESDQAATVQQPRQILDRVKRLLAENWEHPFTTEPCLSAGQLTAWESANGVLLPEEYRLFLLEVGNGGVMAGPYCDFEVWPLDPAGEDPGMAEAFPITRQALDERMARVRVEGRRGDAPLFADLGEYLEHGPPPGCLMFGHYPSYDSLFLVVTGELSGMVWCAVSGGVPEFDRQGRPFGFLTWFEDTLLEAKNW